MPKYTHRYRCHCKDWSHGHFVEDTTENPLPVYNGVQHCCLDNRAGCQRYMKHAETVVWRDNAPPAPIAKSSPVYGMLLVLKYIIAVKSPDVSTVAVMWDAQNANWVYGKSSQGHNLAATEHAGVPQAIRSAIDEGAGDFDADLGVFGWSCAEVDCVIKAYSSSTPRTRADLEGCIFVAANKGIRGNLLDACGSCKHWITKTSGKYAKFSVQGYLGLS